MTTSGSVLPHHDPVLTRCSYSYQERHMKKTVLTFGLISGVMISVLMGGSLVLANKIRDRKSVV